MHDFSGLFTIRHFFPLRDERTLVYVYISFPHRTTNPLVVFTDNEIFSELMYICTDLPTEIVTLIWEKIRRRKVGTIQIDKKYELERIFGERMPLSSAIDLDDDGNIFVAGKSSVFCFRPDGTIFERIPIKYPEKLKVDRDGSLFVNSVSTTFHFSKSGEILQQFETDQKDPGSISIGTDGTIFLCSKKNGGFLVRSPSGDQIKIVKMENAPLHAYLEWNSGNFIAVQNYDSGGKLSVISSRDFSVLSQFETTLSKSQYDIIIDGNNTVLVADEQCLKFFNANSGKFLSSMEFPSNLDGIAVDADGKLIVNCDSQIHIYSPKQKS
jgi:sugar lactone lactonase YvrE